MALATVIDGKSAAASVIEAVKIAAAGLETETGVRTGLAVVIVGDDPASHTYVGAKGRMAKECGFNSIQHTLPAETTQNELAKLVASLNEDGAIHGILVQLPLPTYLNADAIIQSIRPDKDVDGLHVVSAGKLATGDLTSGLISCTPAGAMLLVRSIHGDDLSGLDGVVIGRSNLFGKPMAQLLLAANATVTTAHSKTKDLSAVACGADILVAAVGRPESGLAQAGRNGDRRRHQPHSCTGAGQRQEPAGRRCRLSGSLGCCRRHHAGSGRRRADDDRHADGQYRHCRPSCRGKATAEILSEMPPER
jgi:methylenetetrahydrofolate dehydrogenase (NADP+)/methenyltetrahydrofolate cyclohydrolase